MSFSGIFYFIKLFYRKLDFFYVFVLAVVFKEKTVASYINMSETADSFKYTRLAHSDSLLPKNRMKSRKNNYIRSGKFIINIIGFLPTRIYYVVA